MIANQDKFQTKLEEEKRSLESTLGTLARRSPENPANWELKPETADNQPEFNDEVADRLEELEERQETELEIEERLKEVTAALERIAAGTYGICEVGGEEIEADRLEANPAARTCKKHLNG